MTKNVTWTNEHFLLKTKTKSKIAAKMNTPLSDAVLTHADALLSRGRAMFKKYLVLYVL